MTKVNQRGLVDCFWSNGSSKEEPVQIRTLQNLTTSWGGQLQLEAWGSVGAGLPLNPSGETDRGLYQCYFKLLVSLSSSVCLCVPAIERQRLRHPAQDLHTPSGQRSRASVSIQPLIRPLKAADVVFLCRSTGKV